ncbi:hypothetical protein [uncultured Mucilaginibacter sp.]|uniref:hypothetical protein n=1 Tax=uncultured Mucilaginibacter sp. TaxID=797541 RepID=UPI00262490FA|nr:hypothetical protein [uncultured Mucilaginibacter sp.]
MKILLDIEEGKVPVMMELLENLPFVKAKSLTAYKAEVLEGVKEAVDEVNLIKQSKLKGAPA